MKRKPNERGPRSERLGAFVVRYYDGEIDEIVGPHFHLEFMDSNQVWIGVGKHPSRKFRKHPAIMINFGARGKIWMIAEKN